MKILNLLKKEKESVGKEGNIKHKKDVGIKNEKKLKKIKKTGIAKTAEKKKKHKIADNISYRVLKQPHISEKASMLKKDNQYVFRVSQDANKRDIKNSVENVYSVDVLSVNVIKVPRKSRKVGKISGWRKGYKKAIIKIKQGQKIDILPR